MANTLQYPVRLLGTQTIANNTKGTIYIDSVRAIYGFKNDDNDAPVIADSSVTPANGSATGDRQQTISLRQVMLRQVLTAKEHKCTSMVH